MDIQANDPFGQNRADDDEDDDDEAEKSFLKTLLAERALKNLISMSNFWKKLRRMFGQFDANILSW